MGLQKPGLEEPGHPKLGLLKLHFLNINISKLLNYMQYELTKIKQNDQ